MSIKEPDQNRASVTVALDDVVAAVVAAWEADKERWWGRKRDCSAKDQAEGCDCSYKDCYDHGKWHNCSHEEPDWGPLAIEEVVRRATK